MAIQTATFTFSIPEDADTDRLDIYSSAGENTTYTVEASTSYTYGDVSFRYPNLDDSKWYKVLFVNTNAATHGPFSDPVYGGTYSAAAPFVAISTSWDGANYATTQDVYDYSDLTTDDVAVIKVSKALKRARAEIDYRSSTMGINRFDTYDDDTARRKFNASLVILKEAEICLALGQMYINLSDNIILQNMRDGSGSIAGNISIGDTSISGDSISERSENILYLATLADRYYLMAERKLSALDSNSVRLVSSDYRVKLPTWIRRYL